MPCTTACTTRRTTPCIMPCTTPCTDRTPRHGDTTMYHASCHTPHHATHRPPHRPTHHAAHHAPCSVNHTMHHAMHNAMRHTMRYTVHHTVHPALRRTRCSCPSRLPHFHPIHGGELGPSDFFIGVADGMPSAWGTDVVGTRQAFDAYTGHARHVSVRIHIYTRFFTYHETQQVLTPEQTSTIFMPFTVASLVRCHRTFDRTFNQSNVRSNLPSNVPSSVALNIHRGERVQLARAEHPARPTSGAM